MYPELMKLKAYLGLTTKDLARIAEITQQSMSLKLRKASYFKISEMQKLLKFFKQYYPDLIMDQLFTEEIILPE